MNSQSLKKKGALSELLIHPRELSYRWIDRMADGGIDVLGIHPEGGDEAHRTLADTVEWCKRPEVRQMLDYASERGLLVEYECHAASYLMPRSLFSTHPEYFRMNGEGVRTPDYNFCVSNSAAMELFAQRAAVLAQSLYRSRPVFYFWMDDRKNSHCQCPACRRYSASEQQLMAVNRMAEQIRKVITGARVAYLAYFDSIVLPEQVRPAEGVFLEYAPFEKYTAKGEDAPMRIERERQMLCPLIDLFGVEQFKVLEYWYDNSYFSRWKKPPKRFSLDRERMEREVEEYLSLRAAQIASFACYLGQDYEELYGEEGIDADALGRLMRDTEEI